MRRLYDILLSKSRLTIGLIGFVFIILLVNRDSWRRPDAIRHDMSSYYGYLPAAIIYHDLSLSFAQDPKFGDQYTWTNPAENGRVFRMTMGIAVMEAPFFIIADTYVQLTGKERNAYTPPYFLFTFLGTLFYLIWGLHYLFLLLRGRFNPTIALLTCLAIAFATNLYYYTLDEALMSHTFNFFLYSALLFYSIKWHDTPKISHALKLGIIIGLLTLIRPIHSIAILIPLMYDGHLKSKWQLLLKHPTQMLVVAIISCLVVLPQLFYWKYLSNNWIVYTYGDEHFFFNDPQILRGLFSFRKGWFIYTPIAICAVFGIFPLIRKDKSLLLVFITLIPLYIYVIFSWWCWWYGGSFGSRPMIDILPLFAFPLAAFFFWLQKRLKLGLYLGVGILFMLSALNSYQTRQYKSTLLHWDGSTWSLYQKIFLDNHWPKLIRRIMKPLKRGNGISRKR